MTMMGGVPGIGIIRDQAYALDFNGIYRPRTDIYRATRQFYNSWGAAHANTVMFTVPTAPTGATVRCRVIRLVLVNATATDTNISFLDGATVVFNYQVASITSPAAPLELGGGIICTTNFNVTPSANGLILWGSYIVDFDPPDE